MSDQDEKPFGGFDQPKENYSKLPHAFIEAMPIMQSKAEICVVLYILRHTWGYHEFEEGRRISVDEFANGRKKRDGTRIDQGVGMSEPSIRSGIKLAIGHGFITVEVDDTDKARIEKYYSLNMAGVKSLPPASEDRGKEFTPGQKELTPVHRKITEERYSKKENTAPNGAGSSSPSPNGKKPETPKRKRKTNKQQWLERLEPVSSLVHILLGKFDTGYANGIYETPAEFMTVVHLEKYIPYAEELHSMGATPDKVERMYDWIKPQYDTQKWPVGVKTIVEKYRAWETATAAKPAAAPVQDAYSAWRAQTMADELGGI